MNRIISFITLSVCLLTITLGCSGDTSQEYIRPDEMEEILYDYHLAGVMARQNNADEAQYRSLALQKHGVSQALFDSSMVYYMQNTDELKTIYKHIGEKLSEKTVALGGNELDFNNTDGNLKDGMTNVWKGSTSLVLTPYVPQNLFSFNVPVDTTYHAGDRLNLLFNTDYIIQEGMRDGTALLTVKFKNDSTVTRMLNITSSYQYSLTIDDEQRLGIKSIKGYFMLPSYENGSTTSSTLKVLVVHHIRLLKQEMPRNTQVPDSNPSDSMHVATNPNDTSQRQR